MTRVACKHHETLLLQLPFSQTLLELLSETTSHATMHSWHKQITQILLDTLDLFIQSEFSE